MKNRAFTLIEVVVAVAILSIVGFVMMQFVALNTKAIMNVSQVQLAENRVDGFMQWMRSQIQSMEPETAGLTGDAHEFDGENSSDEISWRTSAGVGSLSQSGQGQFQMKLTLDRAEGDKPPALRLSRTPVEDPTSPQATSNALKGINDGEEEEVILVDNMPGIEIRYFDARVNSWVKRWSDGAALPSLIKVKVWLANSDQTRETTIRVPPIQPQSARPDRPNRRPRKPGAAQPGENSEELPIPAPLGPQNPMERRRP